MADLELGKLISHFALSNRSEGKSPKTEAWYTEMLTDYDKWLGAKGNKATLAALDLETVREFIIHEQERGLSPYTVQAHVRVLKVFSSWLFTEGYMPDNVLAGLKLPKVPHCRRLPEHRHPRHLSQHRVALQ